MSRHRFIRNMRYDDEMESPSEEDSLSHSYSSSSHVENNNSIGEMSPGLSAQYLYSYQPKAPTTTLGDLFQAVENTNADTRQQRQSKHHQQNQDAAAAAADDDPHLKMATVEVRKILGEAFTEKQVDAALQSNNYDVEKAIGQLLDSKSGDYPPLTKEVQEQRMDLEDEEIMSAFAKMLSAQQQQQQQEQQEQSFQGSAQKVWNGADLLTAVYGKPVEESSGMMFQFDEPSPDDVFMLQKGAGASGAHSNMGPGADSAASKPSIFQSSQQQTLNNSSVDGTAVSSAAKGFKVEMPKPRSKVVTLAKAQTPEKSPGLDALSTVGEAVIQDLSSPSQAKFLRQRLKQIDLKQVMHDRHSHENYIALVVTGHVDAGKSTLLGHFLHLLGEVKTRKREDDDLALINDIDNEERERGVTIDIALHYVRVPAIPEKGPEYSVPLSLTLIDSPGHRDFVPAMILGASQANSAVLVIDASPGQFEAGFGDLGQTKEHALLIKALGLSKLIVAVNKLDAVGYDQERYDFVVDKVSAFLKQTGIRSEIQFVPVSGFQGVNILDLDASNPLKQWYQGPSLLGAIRKVAHEISSQRQDLEVLMDQPTRFCVVDVTRKQNQGDMTVTGKVLAGSIALNDRLIVLPMGELVTVKHVEIGYDRFPVAIAGDHHVTLALTFNQQGVDSSLLVAGAILCDPEKPAPLVSSFRAQIVTMSNLDHPLIPGQKAVFHMGAMQESVMISKLVEIVNMRRDKVGDANGSHAELDKPRKVRPRLLVKNQNAVIEIKAVRPVVVENFASLKTLGRFLLRDHGRTIAAGIILDTDVTEKRKKAMTKKSDRMEE